MIYADPNITSMTSLFQYANNITNGIFGFGILISLFFVVYINLSFAENTKAFAVATWVVGLTAVLLRLMGVVNDLVMYTTFILVLIGIISLRGQQQDF